MEKGGSGRAADAIRDSSQQRAGAIDGVMPGVWDFASDGLLVAATLPAGAQLGCGGGVQPAAAAKSAAHRGAAARARGGASPRDGLGRQEVADCFARGRW